MDKKFELTDEKIMWEGRTLYRIKALKDFYDVRVGDLGGFVEKDSNLSQWDNCWIYNNAKVYGNAIIRDNAEVCNDAEIYNNALICCYAMICDNAEIYGSAKIRDCVKIYGNARISDNAEIYNRAEVYDDAVVCGNAEVYGATKVYDKAIVYGNTKVYGCAEVYGAAAVFDYAEVNKEMKISNGCFTKNTIEESVRCQTGLASYNGEIIAYKRVNKDLTSLFDKNFQYVIGEWAEAENPDISDKSCASGLHFSNATYWDRQVDSDNTALLIAKIRIEDIITVQLGKIRCKRAFIIGTCDT